MKIIVFSDSHRDIAAMNRIIETENPDLIFHLGDLERDCGKLNTSVRIIKVRGNCDHGSAEVTERFLDFGNVKILMTHGHEYGVKSGIARLEASGREQGADIVLYGHTHKAYLHKTDDLITMNPGIPGKSYGVILLAGNELADVYLEEAPGMF